MLAREPFRASQHMFCLGGRKSDFLSFLKDTGVFQRCSCASRAHRIGWAVATAAAVTVLNQNRKETPDQLAEALEHVALTKSGFVEPRLSGPLTALLLRTWGGGAFFLRLMSAWYQAHRVSGPLPLPAHLIPHMCKHML